MKVYISADIEGVAGVSHYPSTGPGRFEYEQGRKWMTAEVNAAVRAALEMGATEVVIADGHGSAHNILPDEMLENTALIRSWPRPLIQMQGIEEGGYEAAIFVGHHASSVSYDGLLAHTYTLAFRDIRLNGISHSETSLNSLLAAHYGVPVVFCSGDEPYIKHCLESLGDIETVITKKTYGMSASRGEKPSVIHNRIYDGVKVALARRREIGVLALPEEFHLTLEFNDRSQPDMLDYLPWIKRTGAYTAEVGLKDMEEVMKVIAFVAFYQSKGVPTYGFKMA